MTMAGQAVSPERAAFRPPGLLGMAANRAWETAGAASVRVKVLGIVLGMIVLLGVFVIFQNARILYDTLADSLGHEAAAIALDTDESLANLLTWGDLPAVQDQIERRFQHYSNPGHNTDVAYIAILNAQGEIVAGRFREGYIMEAAPASAVGAGPLMSSDGQVVEVTQAIADTEFVLRLGLSMDPINRVTAAVALRTLTITLIMIGFGFAAAFFLTWVLTRPILELVKGTRRVARGDFSYRVPHWSNDEIGALSTAFNEMTAALELAEAERIGRDQLRQQYISGVILAQENERQRIARELHDSVSQSLTSMLVGVKNLRSARTDAERDEQADTMRAIIAQTLDETRGLSWQLRPSALGELGLVNALERYVQDFEARYGIAVDVLVRGLPQTLPPEIETTIYRIVQEGLTNVARHAQATAASILLSASGAILRIIVEDNGRGFDVRQTAEGASGLGLRGMRERAGLFEGTVEIESERGKGTSVFVQIKLPADEPAAIRHE